MDKLPENLIVGGRDGDMLVGLNGKFYAVVCGGENINASITAHIADSWNACAGIPTAELRPGMLAGLIQQNVEMRARLDAATYLMNGGSAS